jgi:Fur family ferric uptake transcriptional regulator
VDAAGDVEKQDPWIPFRERVEKALKERGFRLTTQRALILEIIFRLGEAVTAEDVFKQAQQLGLDIDLATARRTLDLLADVGLTRVREPGTEAPHYELADGLPPGLLICERCLAVVVLGQEDLEPIYAPIAAKHGYRMISHRTEIHGVCSSCEKTSPKSE